ncbi:MAG: DEAD/DEAH box helicase [Aestuariivita sp.]|nr:DEAD/DEAH box helicase [Aestuariivita sp.]
MVTVIQNEYNSTKIKKPNFIGWLTTDAEEINRRQWRGAAEVQTFDELNKVPFGDFNVPSSNAGFYRVEIRSLVARENSCTCVDYHVSQLGTCKHIEGVLHQFRQSKKLPKKATRSSQIEIYPAPDSERDLKLVMPDKKLPNKIVTNIKSLFNSLISKCQHEDLSALEKIASEQPDLLRVSILCEPWRRQRQIQIRREKKRVAFIEREKKNPDSLNILKFPLYPYQREGVKHLALSERALLADEMGLGKTVQAIGACRVLQDLIGISRVLIVCPASLKTEWAEQINAATNLSYEIVVGHREQRLKQYHGIQFFTITNYEQVMVDFDEMQQTIKPDIVILDEAQRIKNWRTKTATAIKRLQSRFAFVLTGTPLENRIDELYSIMQFLDPELLGPLFRFNREYYKLDNQGRAMGYQNLDKLREKTKTLMLRRRKADVEGDLPKKTVKFHYLPMTEEQAIRYQDYERVVTAIAARGKRRPLLPEEFNRLQIGLASMRMICDTPYILDQDVRDCPKLEELERVLEDMLEDPTAKIIIFSEWVKMLDLVRELIDNLDIGYAWHTGSVPQDRRRVEINRFKQDPTCRIFLSSESGGVGLNLQVASNVINLDLPWNPAKLEQRIARAWRKHQKRSVTVVNLVTSNSIEHRMVDLLEQKQAIADNVLDGYGGQTEMALPSGRKAFLERLEAVMGPLERSQPQKSGSIAKEDLIERLKNALGTDLISAELRKPAGREEIVLAVVNSKENLNPATFSTEPSEPQIEFIDLATHETMMRLEAAGLIQFSQSGKDTLHKTEKKKSKLDIARKNRKHAQKVFEAANRKKQMVELLASGGFEAEAISQSTSVSALSLCALAADIGRDIKEDEIEADNIWQLCEDLKQTNRMSQEQQFKITWIFQADQNVGNDGEPDKKMPTSMDFLSYVETYLRQPVTENS